MSNTVNPEEEECMNFWLSIILIGVVAPMVLYVFLKAIEHELNQAWDIIKGQSEKYKQNKADSMTKNVAKDSDVDDDTVSK